MFSQDELQENFVEGKINDSRVKHRFRHELPNDAEDVGPFTGRVP